MGASAKEYYTVHEAIAILGVLSLNYPIKHGIVTSWGETIWHHPFSASFGSH
jgi:hypothetical protein